MSTFIENVLRDSRYAMRSLRRAPAFTSVGILTLALGIGATTAVYSIVDAVLLRPLPFPHPERLVSLYERTERSPKASVSAPNMEDWRAQSRSFDGMATYRGGESTLLGLAEPMRAQVFAASRDFFRLLGAAPELGRVFLPEESREGGVPVAVVSHAFWKQHLGASRDLGSLHLQTWGMDYRVVGVMPPTFEYPEHAQVWIPIEPQNTGMGRASHNDDALALLVAGVTPAQAQVELSAIAARIQQQFPTGTDALAATVIPLRDDLVGPVQRYLQLLLGAVFFVLLVVCVNLSSASLARGADRAREMAIRTMLGAGRARLVRQLLTESVLLSVAGGAAGLFVTMALMRVLLSLSPHSLPRAAGVELNAGVLAFAIALSLLTGVITGILPALQVAGADLRAAIARGGMRGATADRRGARRALVAAEVALAVVLLVGSGLVIRSFRVILAQDPGFNSSGTLVVNIALPETKYETGTSIRSYFDAALSSLNTTPGITSAAFINIVPLARGGFGSRMEIADNSAGQEYTDYRIVSPNYFRNMQIPLVAGRELSEADDSTVAHVAVINQTLAKTMWPGVDPIGRRLRVLGMDDHRDIWMSIVGVVADVHSTSLTRATPPETFVPYRQRPERAGYASFVVRGLLSDAALANTVRERLRAVDASVPLHMETLNDIVDRSLADRRFIMIVLAAFGVVALLLAAIGIYGVLSYTVAQRTREIGVRIALGAPTDGVIELVLRDTMEPVALGALVGVFGALATTQLMKAFLYQVSTADPITFVAVIVLLFTTALTASMLPTWRATRIDPALALRSE